MPEFLSCCCYSYFTSAVIILKYCTFPKTHDKNLPSVQWFMWLFFSPWWHNNPPVIVALCCFMFHWQVLLEVKMGWDIITVPIPRLAVAFWSALVLGFLVWTFWHFTFPFRSVAAAQRRHEVITCCTFNNCSKKRTMTVHLHCEVNLVGVISANCGCPTLFPCFLLVCYPYILLQF